MHFIAIPRVWGSLCLLLMLALVGCTPFATSSTLTMTPTMTVPPGGSCISHSATPATNVQVSHDTFLAHSEPMVAENPNNPLNLVGGSKFFTDLSHYLFKIGYYNSFDGGCSWTDGGLLPGFEQAIRVSDISFAFDTQNNVYAAVLYAGPGDTSGIAVSTSHDGGKTFAEPVKVFEDTSGKVFSDKPWIGVDTSTSRYRNNIYVVWSYDYNSFINTTRYCGVVNNPPCTQEIAFARSTDEGSTFSSVQHIEGTAPFCSNPAPGRPLNSRLCDGGVGATPAIGPDGTLSVAYLYVSLEGGDVDHITPHTQLNAPIPSRQLVVTSIDGGTTWSNATLIATVGDLPSPFPHESYRNISLPAYAADPQTGQLYITWADEKYGDADILFSTSRDRGKTWSVPLRVNDDPTGNGANQFQPQLAVASDGVVTVAFFDTRQDPAHLLIDTFIAQSNDHGMTFKPNVRASTVSSDPTIKAPIVDIQSNTQFYGDYQGLAVDNNFVHPFWNDTRTGQQDIFTVAIPSLQPLGTGEERP